MLSTNYMPGTRKAKSVHKPITPFSRSLSQFPCSMRRPGVSLLPPGRDTSISQGYPPAYNQASLTICQHPFVLLGERRQRKSSDLPKNRPGFKP